MFKRFLIVLAFVPVMADAVNATFHIDTVEFDSETGRAVVAYSSDYQEQVTVTVNDSGPFLGCVINRLLKDKYAYNSGYAYKGKKIDAIDLATLLKVSHLLPGANHEAIRLAILNYRQSGENDPESIFNEFEKALVASLRPHTTNFQESSMGDSAVTQELKGQLEKTKKKIEVFRQEDQLAPDERALVNRYETQVRKLQAEIASQKPEKKITSGSESPLQWRFCLEADGSRSQSNLSNKNSRELILATYQVSKKLLERRAEEQKQLQKSGPNHNAGD